MADVKSDAVVSRSMMDVIKESFERVKLGALASPKLEGLLGELTRLRAEAPMDDSNLRTKAHWFKRLAETLLSVDLLRQFVENIRDQIPQIWSQLTLKQKLKLGAMAPLVGAGAYLGGIGIAGGGGAVGVPVVLVILLLLLLNHSLIDFLDYVIKQLSIIVRNQPSPDAVSKVFEGALQASMKAMFGRDHDVGAAEQVSGVDMNQELTPRTFETLAVDVLSKKYGGVGYVTRYTADGGIDGYIVCEDRKEVVLVQAKFYKGKVGFPEVTQCLGAYLYWKNALESKFPYPISKIAIACPTDYSIEARKVADAFGEQIILEKVSL